jgi:hypothetical protein
MCICNQSACATANICSKQATARTIDTNAGWQSLLMNHLVRAARGIGDQRLAFEETKRVQNALESEGLPMYPA